MSRPRDPYRAWEVVAMRDADVVVLLLRHGQIASHRGDVALTAEGARTARRAGHALAATLRAAGAGARAGPVRVLSGSTLRARQTAEHLAAALRSAAAAHDAEDQAGGIHITAPRVAFALRNPDLYLAGERVDMVSSPEALAAQVPGLTPEQCAAHPFFATFMGHADRIGWWLTHPSPPGDDARAVVARMRAFVASLLDLPAPQGTVIAVTHSPLVRAVGLACGEEDAGEPAHLSGYLLAARAGTGGDTSPTTALAGRLDSAEVTGAPFDPFSHSLASALRRARPLRQG
jgi:broad specificity phosphatase PhoE